MGMALFSFAAGPKDCSWPWRLPNILLWNGVSPMDH